MKTGSEQSSTMSSSAATEIQRIADVEAWFDLIAECGSRDPNNVIKKVCAEFGQTSGVGSLDVDALVRILQKYGVQYALVPGSNVFSFTKTLFEQSSTPYLLFTNKAMLVGCRGVTRSIPYNKIEEVRIESGEKWEAYVPAQYGGEKSVIAGAVVGGVIAGPAGAVVGAINNKGKPKQISAAANYTHASSNLIIRVGKYETCICGLDQKTIKSGSNQKGDIERVNARLGSGCSSAVELVKANRRKVKETARWANMTEEERQRERDFEKRKREAESARKREMEERRKKQKRDRRIAKLKKILPFS